MPETRSAGTQAGQAAAHRAADAMTIFVLIVATLYFGREVLMPVPLALLLAFVLSPLVNLLRRTHLGKTPSVLIGVTLAFCVVLAIGGVIGSQIAQLTTDIPKYAQTVEAKIATVKNFTIGRMFSAGRKRRIPVGLILSTPLSLCLVVIGRHVKHLAFLDILLGDRPPLTLTETLYQSILAGDADEAEDHAELVLKERSLGTYYDELVVKVMQLAASDAERGFINREQLDRVSRTIRILIRGLEIHKDERPASRNSGNADSSLDNSELPPEHDPRTGPPPGSVLPAAWVERAPLVLCVAGRRPLDGTASFILAQLLDKHGFTGRPVAFDEVSRESIDT